MTKTERADHARAGKFVLRAIVDKKGRWFVNYHTIYGGWSKCSLSYKTKEECDLIIESRCRETPSKNIKDE